MIPDKFTCYQEAVYACMNRVQLVKNLIDDRIEGEETIEGQDQLFALVGVLRDVESDLSLLAEEPYTEKFGESFDVIRKNPTKKTDTIGSKKIFIPRWRGKPICNNNSKGQKSVNERLDKAESDMSELKSKASENRHLNDELQEAISSIK